MSSKKENNYAKTLKLNIYKVLYFTLSCVLNIFFF